MLAKKYRHEYKIAINHCDLLVLRQRFSILAHPDAHATGAHGLYFIRSLYFDSPEDYILREKLDGVAYREKFRIRYYHHDTSFIQLEKKSKRDSIGKKRQAMLTLTQAECLARGDIEWLAKSDDPLLQDFYRQCRARCLRPKTIVDYQREAYIYEPGGVRLTLDYDLRTGVNCTQMFDKDCPTVRPPDTPDILEVKWSSFLPSIIHDAVQLADSKQAAAFSKYAQCRLYD
ncbi:polyphosphate polymerase domain-containing protein [bacterium]|nr:polyphosphate polymerase domain-containing protein [bacterium]